MELFEVEQDAVVAWRMEPSGEVACTGAVGAWQPAEWG